MEIVRYMIRELFRGRKIMPVVTQVALHYYDTEAQESRLCFTSQDINHYSGVSRNYVFNGFRMIIVERGFGAEGSVMLI
jgi:hypothetical protein